VVSSPWINASSAYQLLVCPQRWLESVAPSGRVKNRPANSIGSTGAQVSGTLVHSSVEYWINSGLWRDPQSDRIITDQFRVSAEAEGVPLGRTRLLAASLETRLQDLRSVLDERITDALAEEEVADDETHIRGKIDILCTGPDYAAVIDIKTGRTIDDEGEFLKEITTQLAVYCWLIRALAPLPKAVIVSIGKGVKELPMTSDFTDSTVSQLIEARSQAMLNPVTKPGDDACRFCSLRPVCGPHWVEVSAGKITDAVEGVVTKVESGAGGQFMIQFESKAGTSVMRILENATIDGSLIVGANLRAVRVRQKEPDSGRWIARDSATIYCAEGAFENAFS